MRCKIFNGDNRSDIEQSVNRFIQDKEDVKIELSTCAVGYSQYITIIVYWED